MSILRRLKRLWAISDEPTVTRPVAADHEEVNKALKELFTPRPATIIQDDPLDIFPSDNQDDNDNQTGERPLTD